MRSGLTELSNDMGSSAGRLRPPCEQLPSPLASVGQLAEERDAGQLWGGRVVGQGSCAETGKVDSGECTWICISEKSGLISRRDGGRELTVIECLL